MAIFHNYVKLPEGVHPIPVFFRGAQGAPSRYPPSPLCPRSAPSSPPSAAPCQTSRSEIYDMLYLFIFIICHIHLFMICNDHSYS